MLQADAKSQSRGVMAISNQILPALLSDSL
jgi:hypothetical protein